MQCRVPGKAKLFQELISECDVRCIELECLRYFYLKPKSNDASLFLDLNIEDLLKISREISDPYIDVHLHFHATTYRDAVFENIDFHCLIQQDTSTLYARVTIATVYRVATFHIMFDSVVPDKKKMLEITNVAFLGEYWTRDDRVKKHKLELKTLNLEQIRDTRLVDFLKLYLNEDEVNELLRGIDKELGEETLKRIEDKLLREHFRYFPM